MRFLVRGLGALWVVLLSAVGILLADGGTVQFRKPAGPFLVTLFSEPVPLRVGIADLSVLVENATDQTTVLDASAKLHLSKAEAGRIVELLVPATRGSATNKLLYAAAINLPSPGRWRVTVDVKTKTQAGSASGYVDVLPPEPALMAKWPLFAVVPLMILFFVLNQWLKSRRDIRRR